MGNEKPRQRTDQCHVHYEFQRLHELCNILLFLLSEYLTQMHLGMMNRASYVVRADRRRCPAMTESEE
jgi:hypothetical protein